MIHRHPLPWLGGAGCCQGTQTHLPSCADGQPLRLGSFGTGGAATTLAARERLCCYLRGDGRGYKRSEGSLFHVKLIRRCWRSDSDPRGAQGDAATRAGPSSNLHTSRSCSSSIPANAYEHPRDQSPGAEKTRRRRADTGYSGGTSHRIGQPVSRETCVSSEDSSDFGVNGSDSLAKCAATREDRSCGT